MNKIQNLNEIDYSKQESVSALVSVISIESEGDQEKKKPFKVTLKLEDTGENFQVFSWKFAILNDIKKAVFDDNVYSAEIVPSLYKDTEKQLRIVNFVDAKMKSTKKIIKKIDVDSTKNELKTIIDTYIGNNNSIYKEIIDELVFKNEKFWLWPAATKVHHAYPGGLAKHTLNTTKNAINIWKNYNGSNLNIALIVAGAILHDIGKLTEYNSDGSRTVYGEFVPHPVSGYSRVFSAALKRGIDPEKDFKLISLLHILLTHHEQLEFGASTKPHILEAFIVAKADSLDAVFEAADNSLDNIEVNTTTPYLVALETSLFKWHN